MYNVRLCITSRKAVVGSHLLNMTNIDNDRRQNTELGKETIYIYHSNTTIIIIITIMDWTNLQIHKPN